MEPHLKTLLEAANQRYRNEGFHILGVFGSRARGDYTLTSDLDLMYRMEPRFLELYPGWDSALRVENIRTELEAQLGLKIDLTDRDGLRASSQRSILPEMQYVAPV